MSSVVSLDLFDSFYIPDKTTKDKRKRRGGLLTEERRGRVEAGAGGVSCFQRPVEHSKDTPLPSLTPPPLSTSLHTNVYSSSSPFSAFIFLCSPPEISKKVRGTT
jgi:hypothetical protein